MPKGCLRITVGLLPGASHVGGKTQPGGCTLCMGLSQLQSSSPALWLPVWCLFLPLAMAIHHTPPVHSFWYAEMWMSFVQVGQGEACLLGAVIFFFPSGPDRCSKLTLGYLVPFCSFSPARGCPFFSFSPFGMSLSLTGKQQAFKGGSSKQSLKWCCSFPFSQVIYTSSFLYRRCHSLSKIISPFFLGTSP